MASVSNAGLLLAVERSALQGFQIFQCERAGLEQIGNKQAGRTSEQIEKFAHQSVSELALVDSCLEQLGVPNLLDFANGAFLLESVDEGLHRCVSYALILRQALKDFPDRTSSQFPELLEDPRF